MKPTGMNSRYAPAQLGDGQKLYNYLRSVGITQTQLAEKIGVSPLTVAFYCQNAQLPKRVRKKVLDALGVDHEVVFGKVKLLEQVQRRANPIPFEELELTVEALLIRQAFEWERLLTELKTNEATAELIKFCEHKIEHAELSRLSYPNPF